MGPATYWKRPQKINTMKNKPNNLNPESAKSGSESDLEKISGEKKRSGMSQRGKSADQITVYPGFILVNDSPQQ